MFFMFNARLLVQKKDGNTIYPFTVVNASTTDILYPFTIPAVDIEVIGQRGATDYISPIRFDDIVKLQVSVRFNSLERVVWQTIFEGRVLTPSVKFSRNKNTAVFSCVGHADEARTKLIETAMTTTNISIQTLFKNVIKNNCTRIQYDPLLDATGSTVATYSGTTDFQLKAGQKYVRDILEMIEKLTAYTWYFKARAVYNSNKTLSTPVIIDFLQVPTTPTTQYQVVQGTPRFQSADFEAKGDNVYTRAKIFGQTSGSTQYSGIAENTVASTNYGKRTYSETDSSLPSNTACTGYATGIVTKFGEPITAGEVEILGTPEAKKGDYVYVKASSIDLNGELIDGYYTVMQVEHNITQSSYKTKLGLGYTIASPEAYVLQYAKQTKLAMQNFVT